VVTRANGDVWFWGTSGSKQFKGSRKHTLYAIKAVARSMYYRILSRKIKNLKIVYRGRPNKIRLHEVLGIFQMGAKWDKYDILSIIDMTPLPYNGCRKSKKRR
jgi:small subunit ribosomal protein S11